MLDSPAYTSMCLHKSSCLSFGVQPLPDVGRRARYAFPDGGATQTLHSQNRDSALVSKKPRLRARAETVRVGLPKH